MLKKLLPIMFLFAGYQANAALIELQWASAANTYFAMHNDHPIVSGESVMISLMVDNGNAGLNGQAWTAGDFVSIRFEGASGWYYESSDIVESGGGFSTNAAGGLSWTNGHGWASHRSSTSDNHNYEYASDSIWRLTPIAWGLSYEGGPRSHYVAGRDIKLGWNVDGCGRYNTSNCGDSPLPEWSARLVHAAVPEPSIIALFGLGLVGIGFARRRRS